jgi:hemerythrin-like domain-containing protein
MNLHQQIEHFHKEHDEILRFLKEFESALTLAGGESEKERRAGLAELGKMEQKLAEIREHCREEEQDLESPFQMYLGDFALEDLHTEHQILERRNHDFCAELTAATAPPPTENLVSLGRRLLEHLRHHIAREELLLAQIADGNAAEEKVFLRYTQPGE